jgi:hypothetical protein
MREIPEDNEGDDPEPNPDRPREPEPGSRRPSGTVHDTDAAISDLDARIGLVTGEIGRIHSELDITDDTALAAAGTRLQNLDRVLQSMVRSREDLSAKRKRADTTSSHRSSELAFRTQTSDEIDAALIGFAMKTAPPALEVKEDKTPTTNDALRWFETLDTTLSARGFDQPKYDRERRVKWARQGLVKFPVLSRAVAARLEHSSEKGPLLWSEFKRTVLDEIKDPLSRRFELARTFFHLRQGTNETAQAFRQRIETTAQEMEWELPEKAKIDFFYVHLRSDLQDSLSTRSGLAEVTKYDEFVKETQVTESLANAMSSRKGGGGQGNGNDKGRRGEGNRSKKKQRTGSPSGESNRAPGSNQDDRNRGQNDRKAGYNPKYNPHQQKGEGATGDRSKDGWKSTTRPSENS